MATSTSTITTTTITSTTTTGATTSGRLSCPGPGCPGEYMSTLLLSPVSGPTGTVVAVTGSNYAGTTCSLSSSPSGLFTSSLCTISGGTLTGSFTVASGAVVGSYTVKVTTNVPSDGMFVSASFIVTGATLLLSPVSGPTGTVVAVTGSNYAGTACSLFSTPMVGFFASPPSCAISGGILTGGFVVGASAPAGSYTVTVSSASPSSTAGSTASATFTVTAPGGYLSVNLDKWEYLAGMVVHISGDIYTPYCTWTYTNAGGLAVTLSISDSSGSVILTTTTDPTAAGTRITRTTMLCQPARHLAPTRFLFHTMPVGAPYTDTEHSK